MYILYTVYDTSVYIIMRPTQPRCPVCRADVLNQPVCRRRLGKVNRQTNNGRRRRRPDDAGRRPNLDFESTFQLHNILINT